MKSVCDFEMNPVGAPLGEEITKHDNFTEASCKLSVNFPNFPNRQTAVCSFDSQKEQMFSWDEQLKWNPEGDSLIHRFSIGFKETDLNGGCYSEWPKQAHVAREAYHLYKKVFLAFDCDEAEGLTNEMLRVFHWIKGAPTQVVVYPFEDLREATDEESQKWSWFGPKDSNLVFVGS